LNYLATIVIGALLWVVLGILLGNYLGDTVSLQSMTTDQFLTLYRGTLGAVAVVAILQCLYWYYYGSRSNVSSRLPDARRLWVSSLCVQVIVAVIALVVLILQLHGEALAGTNYVTFFVVLLLQTVALFWVSTLVFSPRAVEYIPWGRR
jgi:hypothetical protein